MTNAKHTIAPWKLCSNEQGQNFQIIGADSLPVCVMSTAKSSSLANWGNKKVSAKTLWTTTANEVEQANARLIASAPELLAALKQIEANAGIYYAETISEIARAAIAKARGE